MIDYLLKFLVVAAAVYYVPKTRLSDENTLTVALVATLGFMLLDTVMARREFMTADECSAKLAALADKEGMACRDELEITKQFMVGLNDYYAANPTVDSGLKDHYDYTFANMKPGNTVLAMRGDVWLNIVNSIQSDDDMINKWKKNMNMIFKKDYYYEHFQIQNSAKKIAFVHISREIPLDIMSILNKLDVKFGKKPSAPPTPPDDIDDTGYDYTTPPPPDATPTPPPEESNTWIIVLAVAGAAVLLGGIALFWASRRKAPEGFRFAKLPPHGGPSQ